MSIKSDTTYIKMPFSPSEEIKIDACISFKFNIDRIIERNGHASARVLLAYSSQGEKKAFNYLSNGDCLFDCLGFSDSERLELAIRSRTSEEYIICKTRYGASILITKLIATQGIALLLIPDEATSASLRKVLGNADSISYSELYDLSESRDGTVFRTASKLLLLVEKSIMCSRSASEKECLRLEVFETVYAISELLGIHPNFLTPVTPHIDASPSLCVCLTYLFSAVAAKLSTDGHIGIKVIEKGRQSIMSFSIRLKSDDEINPFVHYPEMRTLINLINELDIMDSYSITKGPESDVSVLGISALLCRKDPSLIGLKHPKPRLYSETADESED